jgi:hypothetical protein
MVKFTLSVRLEEKSILKNPPAYREFAPLSLGQILKQF